MLWASLPVAGRNLWTEDLPARAFLSWEGRHWLSDLPTLGSGLAELQKMLTRLLLLLLLLLLQRWDAGKSKASAWCAQGRGGAAHLRPAFPPFHLASSSRNATPFDAIHRVEHIAPKG
jgi:hypothetical protein